MLNGWSVEKVKSEEERGSLHVYVHYGMYITCTELGSNQRSGLPGRAKKKGREVKKKEKVKRIEEHNLALIDLQQN